MKKILFLISSLRGGGAERALSNITLAMPDDVEFDILVNFTTDKDYPHKGNVISLDLPKKDNFSLLYQIRAFLKRIAVLRKMKRNNNYDACISFMDSANFANILSGKRCCKVIVSVRNTLSQSTSGKYKYIVNPFVRILYPHADKIIALSKGTEWDLEKNFKLRKQKLGTIYNGYSIAAIKKSTEMESSVWLDEDCFYFITVGRLCRQKGQWHLIRAFSKVASEFPECRLIICGQGAYEEMLRETAVKFNVSDKVIFTGFIRNTFAVAKKCNVFVFPSLYEGFGNVMIENMACGLPVIASDFRSGAREILAPDTDFRFEQTERIEKAKYGVIVPVCSGKKLIDEPLEKEEKLLTEAMLEMYENEELRSYYSKASVERAEDFDVSKVVSQWLALCE
ncbi:MAG: glycosyltransferase [Lachnospiraceae bacterium]|nr:glycosyltransferase [Lachnospiraceae bacterium]